MRYLSLLALSVAPAVLATEWSKPAEIVVDDTVCATYEARLDSAGDLVVRVRLAEGWHTFALDNDVRAKEKLAGRKALSADQPTVFTLTGGLAVAGPWRQAALKDFSQPDLRIFSWGFEKEALFAVKTERREGTWARIAIRAQACTPSICKNIQAELAVNLAAPATPPEPGTGALTAALPRRP